MKNFQKFAKEVNEVVEKSEWDNKKMIKVEHTAFNPLHRVSRGRNGVSRMLELQTVVTEANDIHFEIEPKYNYIALYVNSEVEIEHGFNRYKSVFLRLKDAKGKYHSLTINYEWIKEDRNVNQLIRVLNASLICTSNKSDFERVVDEEVGKVLRIQNGEEIKQDIYGVIKNYTENLLISLFHRNFDDDNKKKFEELCKHCGVTIVRMYQYTEELKIFGLDFIIINNKSLEIGWHKSQTYNALPHTIKISLVNNIPNILLSDLNIEEAGYYSHDDKMIIRADQKEDAKKFISKFNSSKTKVINNLLKVA